MSINLVAEIGINHNGKKQRAKSLIKKFAPFVSAVKFQKLVPEASFSKKQLSKPHPVKENAYGETYLEHKNHLEFSADDLKEIKRHAHDHGVLFGVSIFDLPSVADVEAIGPDYVKIPSCRNNYFKLIDLVEKTFGQYHISTGMTKLQERYAIRNRPGNKVVYSCTSSYDPKVGPVYIERLPGFSCHVPDIFFAKAAILNGAKWIEYHVTDNRQAKGTDHKVSLLPEEMQELSEWIKTNQELIDRISFKKPQGLPDCEITAREKLYKK